MPLPSFTDFLVVEKTLRIWGVPPLPLYGRIPKKVFFLHLSLKGITAPLENSLKWEILLREESLRMSIKHFDLLSSKRHLPNHRKAVLHRSPQADIADQLTLSIHDKLR